MAAVSKLASSKLSAASDDILCKEHFFTIAGLLASEEQKRELLPDMARLKKIGAWGLTEPSNGSDASALQSTARKVWTSKVCTACNN